MTFFKTSSFLPFQWSVLLLGSTISQAVSLLLHQYRGYPSDTWFTKSSILTILLRIRSAYFKKKKCIILIVERNKMRPVAHRQTLDYMNMAFKFLVFMAIFVLLLKTLDRSEYFELQLGFDQAYINLNVTMKNDTNIIKTCNTDHSTQTEIPNDKLLL